MNQKEIEKKVLRLIPIIGVLLVFVITGSILYGVWGGDSILAIRIIATSGLAIGLLVMIEKILLE